MSEEETKPIPKPKKPRKWDGWVSVGLTSLFVLGVLIFSGTEFTLNAVVCGALIPVVLIYYSYYLLFARRKREQKYRKEMQEYQRLTSSTRYRSKHQKHRKEMARQANMEKSEIDKMVNDILGKTVDTWDTKDFTDLLKPSLGGARVKRRPRGDFSQRKIRI